MPVPSASGTAPPVRTEPQPLDRGHLGDRDPCGGEPAVDHGLDLEPVAPQHLAVVRCRGGVVRQVEQRDQVGPERVVAIAEVGVPGPEAQVDERVEELVAQVAHGRDVAGAPARGVPRALGEVRAGLQRLDEPGDLGGVRGPVGVEHDDDVTRDPGEAGGQGVALALAGLEHVMISGRARRAARTVPSTEPPSTRMTSWTLGSCGSTAARFSASLSAGTTMLISGSLVSRRPALNLDPPCLLLIWSPTILCSLRPPSRFDRRNVGSDDRSCERRNPHTRR
jgi:hypothetical protein